MPDSADLPPVAVVGAGAVGSALARALQSCGYRIAAVLSRTLGDAEALAHRVEAPVAGATAEALPSQARLVMVCVPDDEIVPVATSLASTKHPWSDTIVAHTSGARTAAALAPLAEAGAATLSFHPLQTFTPSTPPDAFEGIVVGLEGDDRAVASGTALAQALGARPLPLSADDKTRYHAAAALASNGLVALMGVVEEILTAGATQMGDVSPHDLVGPLVAQTWDNLEREPPEDVLTGPVVRGDLETIEAHLEALTESSPHLVPLYAALSTEMVRLAVRGGRLPKDRADAVLGVLRTATDAFTEDEGPPPLTY